MFVSLLNRSDRAVVLQAEEKNFFKYRAISLYYIFIE